MLSVTFFIVILSVAFCIVMLSVKFFQCYAECCILLWLC